MCEDRAEAGRAGCRPTSRSGDDHGMVTRGAECSVALPRQRGAEGAPLRVAVTVGRRPAAAHAPSPPRPTEPLAFKAGRDPIKCGMGTNHNSPGQNVTGVASL